METDTVRLAVALSVAKLSQAPKGPKILSPSHVSERVKRSRPHGILMRNFLDGPRFRCASYRKLSTWKELLNLDSCFLVITKTGCWKTAKCSGISSSS